LHDAVVYGKYHLDNRWLVSCARNFLKRYVLYVVLVVPIGLTELELKDLLLLGIHMATIYLHQDFRWKVVTQIFRSFERKIGLKLFGPPSKSAQVLA